MAWCPNCDEIRDVAASTACPVCSADTLDAERLRTPEPRGGLALLELAPEAPPSAPGEPAAFSIRSSFTRRTLVAGVVALAVAGGAVAAAKLTGSPAPRPKAQSSVPSSPAATAPDTPAAPPELPLGSPAKGVLLADLGDDITALDLTNGEEFTPSVPASQGVYAAARNGQTIAFIAAAQNILWVVDDVRAGTPQPVASDVIDFQLTDDGQNLIVLRSQPVNANTLRFRVERRSLDGGTIDLVFETTRSVGSIFWRRGAVFLQMSDAHEMPGLYEVTGRSSARLVRNKVTVLDMSPDAERALVKPSTGDPGLALVSTTSRKASAVGPANLLVNAARFSPNGTAIAIVGTTNYERQQICGDGPECGGYEYAARDWVVQRYDVASQVMRRVAAGTEIDSLTWGPANWLFFSNGGFAMAVRDDGTDLRQLILKSGGTTTRITYLP